MYKKILVATDGSTLSKKAINSAIALAQVHGSSLIAVKVIPRFTQTYFEGSIPVNMGEVDKIEKSWADHAHKQLDKVAKDAKAKQVSALILSLCWDCLRRLKNVYSLIGRLLVYELESEGLEPSIIWCNGCNAIGLIFCNLPGIECVNEVIDALNCDGVSPLACRSVQ